MEIKKYFPLLEKVLFQWFNSVERPPLLLLGMGETEWRWLKKEILTIALGQEKVNIDKGFEHPDILVLEKKEDKSVIEIGKNSDHIGTTRNFIYNLFLSTNSLPFKIGFIPRAEHLGVESQNALLKTFEEPARNRFIILGASETSCLLPTVLSRCLVFNFVVKSDELVLSFLKENYPELSAPKMAKIVVWSNKSLGQAKKIAENWEYWEDIFDFAQKIRKIDLHHRVKESSLWKEEKKTSGKLSKNLVKEKITDFFLLELAEMRKKRNELMEGRNFLEAGEINRQIVRVLDYFNQSQKINGASPGLMLEAVVLNL